MSGIIEFWSNAIKDNFYFIAEIGNNHNGDINKAIELIDIAVEAGVNSVKFQMRDMDTLYRNETNNSEDLGVEYIKDLLSKYNLTTSEHLTIKQYCEAKNVDYLCTPWDLKSVKTLEDFGVPAFKVASADFTNLSLLKALKKTKKPLILSTGMTTQSDLDLVCKFLDDHMDFVALLHCNSTYPAPFQDINLRQLATLKKYSNIIGYSGHERGSAITLAAYALGAQILERHITLDRTMEGPDHAASLEPNELQSLMRGLLEIQAGLGTSGPRKITQGEMINRENLAKSLVASSDISTGKIIEKSDISVVSPGRGLSPLFIDRLVGAPAKRSLKVGDFFEEFDIKADVKTLRTEYSILGSWGIPVRYHDYEFFRSNLNASMWEFHLSYKDLEKNASSLAYDKSTAELVVHAPELFAGSHLLDLTSPVIKYREVSILNMKKVIEQTKALSSYFSNTNPVKIVTNVGGFSMDGPLSEEDRSQRYDILSETLSTLADPAVEIIPQTMAPFPWHFGGQRFQNIFLDADEISLWCERLSIRICLDTSHSKLCCNHRNHCFGEFVEKLLPNTAHIHLGDANGFNGEGLQIGEGEIDFLELFSLLKNKAYDGSILPEIWQGHKNGGEGFAIALEKMEILSNEK